MISVEKEWLLRVRELLYALAHEKGVLAQEAEFLGSFLPEFLTSDSDE